MEKELQKMKQICRTIVDLLEKEEEGTKIRIELKEEENVLVISKQPRESIRKLVFEKTKEIGVAIGTEGYRYIIEACVLGIENMEYVDNITKLLYPEIAKKYKTTPSRVERGIRYAIEKTWLKGNQEAIERIFGYTVSFYKGKPTNTEFIAMMVEEIIIENSLQRNPK